MINRVAPLALAVLVVSSLWSTTAAADDTGIVKQFIFPGSSIAQLSEADPITGRVVKTTPAILHANLISGDSGDSIVFAETTDINGGKTHVLSINILQAGPGGYRNILTKTYYDKVLYGQAFKTIGLQRIFLTDGRQGILVITSSGAALGGDIEIFTWKSGLGFVNVVPDGIGGGYGFTWTTNSGRFEIEISYRRSRLSDSDVPPPTNLVWSEEKDIMVPVK